MLTNNVTQTICLILYNHIRYHMYVLYMINSCNKVVYGYVLFKE